MILPSRFLAGRTLPTPSCAGAFTISQLLVSISIFTVVMGGILSSHLFGMRLMTVSQIKLSATDGVPHNLRLVTDDLRAAKRVRIGQFLGGAFQEVAPTSPHQGNAVQLFFSVDTNNYAFYYLDSSDQKFKRMDPQANIKIIFEAVANTNLFAFEDFLGKVITNDRSYNVTSLNVRFSALNHSQVTLGTNQVYSSFEIHRRIARRSLD